MNVSAPLTRALLRSRTRAPHGNLLLPRRAAGSTPAGTAGARPPSRGVASAAAAGSWTRATGRRRLLPLVPPSPPGSRSLFIQTATTPNPESLKFIPNGRLVLRHGAEEGGGSRDEDRDGDEDDGEDHGEDEDSNVGVHLTRKDASLVARSPLAKCIFDLDEGIKSVYLGRDFLTVTKYAEAHWYHLQTPVFGAIMDFYASGRPAVLDAPVVTDTTVFEDDDEVVAMIKELLETRIRPAVQEDGGDIKYVGFEEGTGVVTVQLAGSCVGCPSSSVTLKNGVENMLMHYIPEVTNVVSLEEEEEDDEGGGGEGGGGGGGGEGAKDAEGEKMKTYQERLAAAGIPFSD
ncbi:hypothetical protein ACHAWF_003811 [Thalassiosira exigua]